MEESESGAWLAGMIADAGRGLGRGLDETAITSNR